MRALDHISLLHLKASAVFGLAIFATLASPQSVQPVPDSAELTHPLHVGDQLPAHIVLKTVEGTRFDLTRSVHSKPTVIIFYRGGWCPFCNLQMGQLEQAEPKLEKMGYQLIAISADNPAHLKQSLEKHDLTYTLLSDSQAIASRAFGLAFRVDAATLQKYKEYHIDLEAASGNKEHILPVPAAYVFDTAGRIHFAYSNPDYKVRVDPEKLLKAAQEALHSSRN